MTSQRRCALINVLILLAFQWLRCSFGPDGFWGDCSEIILWSGIFLFLGGIVYEWAEGGKQ